MAWNETWAYQVLIMNKTFPAPILEKHPCKFNGHVGTILEFSGRKYRVTNIDRNGKYKDGTMHYGQNVWVVPEQKTEEETMNEIFMYNISIKHNNTAALCAIRTDDDIHKIAERLDTTPEEIACRVVNKKSPCDIVDYAAVKPNEITEIRENRAKNTTGFTIHVEDPVLKFGYYICPEGACRISVHRFDRNTTESYTDQFLVPSNILNMDCDGKYVKKLFRQIAREFNQTENKPTCDVFTWHDFVSIPNEFLKQYGVKQLERPDIMLYVNVDANENLIDPEG